MNETEKFWDRVSSRFEKRSHEIDPVETRALEKSKRHLHADDIVLDYGCGIGTMAIEISDGVKRMHGQAYSTGDTTETHLMSSWLSTFFICWKTVRRLWPG